ncbi:hypothetical protein GCM10015535_43680 [Streptomyces gelaticus]|uniref:Uncharacterized protein n=1 Tax=Streptomyces gelaticus TaxID=285446 RepID=A0ABQ2W4V9_9ACTN|nr:hypothetical protein GCM10015535_43680 [Streptomyces gelaticus]
MLVSQNGTPTPNSPGEQPPCHSTRRHCRWAARRTGHPGAASRPGHCPRAKWVFNARYPPTRTELGFLEAEVTFQADSGGSFGGVTAAAGAFAAVPGRWRVADGVIATAVVADSATSWKSGRRPSRATPPGPHLAARPPRTTPDSHNSPFHSHFHAQEEEPCVSPMPVWSA